MLSWRWVQSAFTLRHVGQPMSSGFETCAQTRIPSLPLASPSPSPSGSLSPSLPLPLSVSLSLPSRLPLSLSVSLSLSLALALLFLSLSLSLSLSCFILLNLSAPYSPAYIQMHTLRLRNARELQSRHGDSMTAWTELTFIRLYHSTLFCPQYIPVTPMGILQFVKAYCQSFLILYPSFIRTVDDWLLFTPGLTQHLDIGADPASGGEYKQLSRFSASTTASHQDRTGAHGDNCANPSVNSVKTSLRMSNPTCPEWVVNVHMKDISWHHLTPKQKAKSQTRPIRMIFLSALFWFARKLGIRTFPYSKVKRNTDFPQSIGIHKDAKHIFATHLSDFII